MNRDIASLHDILSAGNLILDFIENKTFSDFEDDAMLNSDVCRQLEIIGEATKRLSKEIREENANIPWREMAGLRDIISHGYDIIDNREIWSVCKHSIPELLSNLDTIIVRE